MSGAGAAAAGGAGGSCGSTANWPLMSVWPSAASASTRNVTFRPALQSLKSRTASTAAFVGPIEASGRASARTAAPSSKAIRRIFNVSWPPVRVRRTA